MNKLQLLLNNAIEKPIFLNDKNFIQIDITLVAKFFFICRIITK